MSVPIGTRLGSYDVLELIGSGGMGEVYRARDLRLKRDVAIKILPEAFAADPDRLARFQREAEALALLSHPNIATIHHIEEVNPSTGSGQAAARFLVLELVNGETLADRIQRGPMPHDEALRSARQIADALEAAHDKGVVHRDLKPANVKVLPDGNVKVLDFGLAKMFDREPVSAALSNSPTVMSGTLQGVILGTAAYMSPEQARGQPVDKRTDIWAFGCVLFEMLTGQPAFGGATATDIIAAIVTSDPDWKLLSAVAPQRTQALVRRCLQKDPRRRRREIADARIEIDEILTGGLPAAIDAGSIPATNVTSVKNRRWMVAAAAIGAVAVGGAVFAAWSVGGRRTDDVRAYEFQVDPPDEAIFSLNTLTGAQAVPYPALSPDGRYLAFIAIGLDRRQGLWVRPLESKAATLVPGTEGATVPFWSPNSRFIGFFSGGKLKTVPVSGGPPQTLCDVDVVNLTGTWNRDDVILFSSGATGTISRVSAAGGPPVAVTTLDPLKGETGHWWPHFLPDGRHFLYFAQNSKPDERAVYVGSIDSEPPKVVFKGTTEALYASPGYVLFMRERNLMAQPFDAARLQLAGDAFPIAEQLAGNLTNGKAALSVSDAGIIAYRTGVSASSRQIAWLDRAGNRAGTVGPIGSYLHPELSGDGKRLAITQALEGGIDFDVWLLDLARGVPTRFTFDAAPDTNPVWSPDGSRVVFRSQRNEAAQLYQKSASGSGSEDMLASVEGPALPLGWSSDGEHLLYLAGAGDLWVLPQSGDRKPFAFLQTPFDEGQGQLSPDGRWLAYRSNESGRSEIYVQPFPTPSGKWQISSDGGVQPRWRGDGKELYYVSPGSRRMIAVPISTTAGFDVGTAVSLFDARFSTFSAGSFEYDVTADGQRFIVVDLLTEARNTPLTVVVNWTARLR